MQVEYKVGDIILVDEAGRLYLKECEITEISVKGKCLKIDDDWRNATEITTKIKAVIGRAIYKRGLFGINRTVQYL